MEEMWYVYVLLCEDGSFYTGSTNNLENRFLDHQKGRGGRYTRSHQVVKMVYSETLSTKGEALKREWEIKSWKRGKKIKELKLVY